jgi:integral membrane protein
MNWFKYFRIISLIEGISYLVLVFIAMPLKYLDGNLLILKNVGMLHGVLFILFVVALIGFIKKYKHEKELGIDFFVYSIIPFGFLLIEMLVKRTLIKK